MAIESLPAKQDIALYQGDDFYLDITVKNQDGTPANIAAATPKAQIRTVPEDPTILASFVATITTNVIHLHLLAAASALLIPGPAYWDIQIAMPDVTTLMAGKVTIHAEVTR